MNLGVAVSSTHGFALPWVEVDGERRDVVGEEGASTVRIAPHERPARVRAPGHAEAVVEAGDRELVLEPDALFVLEAPNFAGARARVWRKDGEWAEDDESALDLGADGRVRVAFRVHPGEEQTLDLELPDERLFAGVTVEHGMRVLAVAPGGPRPSRSPLGLSVHAAGANPRVEIELALDRQRVRRGEEEWGRWALYDTDPFHRELVVDRSTGHTLRVDDVPHAPLRLFADAGGRHRWIDFLHDGRHRTLHVGHQEFTADVVTSDRHVPAEIRIEAFRRWGLAGFVESASNRREYEDGKLTIISDYADLRDGLVGSAPPLLVLEVHARGYPSFERTYAVDGRSPHPLGVIQLEAPLPDMTIAPGCWEGATHGSTVHDVSLVPRGMWRVVSAIEGDAGELRLKLSDLNGPVEVPAFVRLDGELLRRVGAWYEPVPLSTYRPTVEFAGAPAGADGLHVGWSWLGDVEWLTWFAADEVGAVRELEFEAPSANVELWWSRGSQPAAELRPGEGSQPLDPGESDVRVP